MTAPKQRCDLNHKGCSTGEIGQQATSQCMGAMSVRFTLKADIVERDRHVRFGSKADIAARPLNVRLPPKADIGSRGHTAQRSALSSCWIDRSVRPTELAVGPLSAFAERNSLAAPY